MAQKWTNADLSKVSKFGGPDLSTFEPEQLNLDGFEPLQNVDLKAKPQTPYTGDPNRQPVQGPEDRSLGSDIWTELNRPHLNVHQYTDKAADYIDNPTLKPDWMPDALYKGIAMLKGAHAGAVQGLGNLAEGFTSDLGLLTALPTDGLAGVAPSAANALRLANKGAGAAFAVSGAQKVLDSKKPWSERVTGIPEMAGGAAAFLHTPAAKPTEPTLTAGERLGKEFDSKIEAPKPPAGPPPVDFEALRQPNLRAVNNDPFQYNLLDEHNPFTSSARQQPLVPEARPEPFTDTAEQGKLDLTPMPVRLPNEFLPEGSYESKLTPEQQGAPRSLFEKPTPKLEPEKVPFKRVPDDILDEMIASKPDYSNPRLERVPIESLRATQDTLNPDAVNDYIAKGDRPELTEVPAKAKGRMDDEAPVVIRVGDENILAGGHHRATADLANGKSDIQAVVYDAPNVSDDLMQRLKASIEKDRTVGTKRPFEDLLPKESRNFGDKRGAADYAEDLKKTINDENAHEQTMSIAEHKIMNETDPEIIKDNFNQLEEYLLTEKNPDLAESYQHLRDVALDKVNKSGLRKQIRTSGEPDYFPKEMRAKQKPENVAMGGADPRVLDVLGSSLYSKRPELIAAKELLQNAIDEHKISGSKEPIRTLFNHYDKLNGENSPSIEIGDRGRGLTKEQIYTVLTDVGKTGKLDEAAASGGFGFAKASPMLGGKYSRFESVVDEGGKRVRHTFEGTPEQLKNQEEGVPIKTEVVDPNTPTGFRAKVYYDDNASLHSAKEFTKAIGESSHDMPSSIHVLESFGENKPEMINDYFNTGKVGKYDDPAEVYDPKPANQLQDTIKLPGADVDIHYDPPDKNAAEQNYEVNILNNGMFQFKSSGNYSYRGAIKGVPGKIIANVRANVPEGKTNYPYTANREQLSAHITQGINKWIQDNLVAGAHQKQLQALKDMYNQMHSIPEPNANAGFANRRRPSVIFDPNNLLDPQELKQLTENGFIHQFATTVDEIIARALGRFKSENWPDKIEKVGISLDPEHHGVWIPNPDRNGKATILLNPFNFIDKFNNNPTDAALEMMSTAWHEVGHTGEVTNTPLDWSKVDTSDPGIGDFFKKYLDEVQHANAVQDSGHGLEWLRATAEVYARSGVKRWNEGVEGIFNAFTDNGNYLGYSKEVQDALRLYQERAGRVGAEENILSRTGVSEKSRPSETESIFGDAGSNGERSSRPVNPKGADLTKAFNSPIKWSEKVQPQPAESIQTTVRKLQRSGEKQVEATLKQNGDALKQLKNAPEEGVTRDEKENMLEKALNFQRTVLTSVDLSAPGRQGLPLIGRKEWWTSWKPMFEALGSDKGYETVMDSIKNDPSGLFTPANKGKSYANEAGLSLTDKLDHREELFRSKWAEEFKGTSFFVKPSVRAYTAYLNKLRADTFKNMVKAAQAENNLPAAKAIADYINVATGRGSLGAFDPAGKALAQVFFSPRLAASRMQMYTRTFNPWYYASVPKEVRVNQLKSMLALAGTGLAMGQLAKGIGATVELDDPYNSDFGKIRFGNTRIDPFAGHQQYLVAAARLLMGKTTSSTTGKTHSLTTGKFGMPNRASVFGNFMKNKLAPVPSFIWSWMEGKSFDGKPFDAKNEAMQRIVPIVTQDLYDIWKSDPTLLQGLMASGSAMIGGGVQTYGR